MGKHFKKKINKLERGKEYHSQTNTGGGVIETLKKNDYSANQYYEDI